MRKQEKYELAWTHPKTLEQDCFLLPTRRARDLLSKIINASKQRYLCKITYQKVSSGQLVKRTIRPYSYNKHKYILYATELNHRSDEIRSFRVDRIRSVKVLRNKFKPKFEVEL